MSNINFSAIDTAYPVAGQDNDSQGFRDNFTAISTGLAVAKSEITTLQNESILTSNETNNLYGSTLYNGLYNQFYGVVHPESVLTDISLTNGSFQVFTVASTGTLTFRNWPDTNQYALIKVHIKTNNTQTGPVISFATENGGAIVKESTFPNPFTLNTSGKHSVIEAWTYDGGAHVYVRYLGLF